MSNKDFNQDNVSPDRYNLTVRACTVGGCADSEGVIFITKSAPPTSMPAPVITAISSTQLLVEWQPPLSPNGEEEEFSGCHL